MFKTFDAASRFDIFVTLMFYLLLTPASKPQRTHASKRQVRKIDREKQAREKNTTMLLF